MANERHSKLAVVKLGTAGAPTVVTTISSYCNKFEIPDELEENEVTTFGDTRKRFIAGYASANASMGGPWSRALDNHLNALLAAFQAGTIDECNYEYGPEGTDSSDVKYSGALVLLKFSGAKAATGNPLEWDAEMRVNSKTVGAY